MGPPGPRVPRRSSRPESISARQCLTRSPLRERSLRLRAGRVCAGLDDYGLLGYRVQKLAEDPWLEKRGYRVLELPTGQGLLVNSARPTASTLR